MPKAYTRALRVGVACSLVVGSASCSRSVMNGAVAGSGGARAGNVSSSSSTSAASSSPSSSSTTSGGAGAGVDAGSPCAGAATWTKRWGDATDQIGQAVAASPGGAVALAGAFRGAVDFGGGPLTSASSYGIYVAELDSDGSHVWSRAYPGGSDVVSGAGRPLATVGMAPSGDVVLGGTYAGTTDFGAGPVTSLSAQGDGFVVAFDPAGHPLWSALFGDEDDPDPAARSVESLAIDGDGNVVALVTTSALPLGALDLVKLDHGGTVLWQKSVAQRGTLDGAVRVDAAGDVVVAGITYDEVDFGGDPIPGSSAAPSLFVAKLDPSGDPLWTASSLANELRLEPGSGLALDAAGDVYVAGGGGDLAFDLGCGTAPLGWSTKLVALDGATGACRWMTGSGDFGGPVAVLSTGDVIVATSGGESLIRVPTAGPSDGACQHAYTQNVSAEVHGLAALPSGGLLMTGAFALTANFADDPSGAIASAGQRDVFLARF